MKIAWWLFCLREKVLTEKLRRNIWEFQELSLLLHSMATIYNPQNDLFAEPKTKRLRFAVTKSKRNGQNQQQNQKRNGLHFNKHAIQNNA